MHFFFLFLFTYITLFYILVDIEDTRGWKMSCGRKCRIITKSYQKNGSNEGRSRALKLPINCFILIDCSHKCVNINEKRREGGFARQFCTTASYFCAVWLGRLISASRTPYRPRWVLVRFCLRDRVCRTGVGFAGSFASLRVSGYLLRSDNAIARCKTFGFSLPFFSFTPRAYYV